MRRALELAADSFPHPNPRVGAVLIDPGGQVLAEGHHRGPGTPHAERACLDSLDAPPPVAATMVVTLEPCDHHGRTPPCTEAILAAGLRRVVVGALDPDPRVSGKGIERLRAAGVEVEVGLLAGAAEEIDGAYFHHRRLGRPRLTLKTAMTLDGQTAAADGTSRWITGPEARQDAHRLRAAADAVMVGAGTLRADDPLLTARLPAAGSRQPRPIVVAGRQPLPAGAAVWDRPGVVVVAAHDPGVPVETVLVPAGSDGLPDLTAAMTRLGELGLLDILVEGGATLASALWRAGLVDRGVTYLGALVAGGDGIPPLAGVWTTLGEARRARIERVGQLGEDLRIDWTPVRDGPDG